MVNEFKEFLHEFRLLWKEDRKEFWDVLLGALVVGTWTFFTLFVLLPVLGGL